MILPWPSGSAGTQEGLTALIAVTVGLAALAAWFTAAAVVERWWHDRRERRAAALESSWEGPVLDVLHGRRTAASVHGMVRPRDGGYLVEYVHRLARRLPADQRTPLAHLAAPFLERTARGLGHRDEAVRVRAIQSLSLLAFDAFADRFALALDDRSTLVALVAARALARGDRPGYAPAVIRRLPRFSRFHAPLVSAVVAELGLAAAPSLLAAFADPGQPATVRALVADALRALQAPGAAEVAAGLVSPERDGELVAACLRLLSVLGRHEHLDVIRPLLTCRDDELRAQAIATFGALAGPDEAAALVPALDDPSPWVARAAARALCAHGAGGLLRVRAAGPSAPPVVAEVLAEGAA